MLGHNEIITGNFRNDYSFITATATSRTLIARCVTGLGPSGSDDNNALGGLHFNGNRISNGACDSSTAIQSNGAPINDFVGVMNLYQCEPLQPSEEGVYTCMMMNSSMMLQSMRLGVYLSGRSKHLAYMYVSS